MTLHWHYVVRIHNIIESENSQNWREKQIKRWNPSRCLLGCWLAQLVRVAILTLSLWYLNVVRAIDGDLSIPIDWITSLMLIWLQFIGHHSRTHATRRTPLLGYFISDALISIKAVAATAATPVDYIILLRRHRRRRLRSTLSYIWIIYCLIDVILIEDVRQCSRFR